MKKIYKDKEVEFRPYSILVETEIEDRFLKGFAKGNSDDRLEDCNGYCTSIHLRFDGLWEEE